jgi:predicted ATPase
LKPTCNVIVGPNATGKTTLLEAIRLAKALVAPRTQAESNQTLTALGVNGPGNQTSSFKAIAQTETLPIQISCTYKLSNEELELLNKPESLAAMATQMMLAGMGRQFGNPAALIGLISSPMGRINHQQQLKAVQEVLTEVTNGTRPCLIDVTIDVKSSQITSADAISGVLIGFLDRRLPPSRSIFSYFPADRAIPQQDQPVQIGIADAAQQIESYNSQPQLKYSRLKNAIFSTVIAGKGEELSSNFKAIFSKILRGKSLKNVGLDERGALKILIEDESTKSAFSIDAMSSGEKGLILTFLLIAQNMERGGVVLLDEPELHLNPAVCREVLSFLMEEYALTRELQLIICSHSPEILGVAFEREDCGLYHFISGTILTPVRRQDLEEVEGALRRLGSSPTESLLYRGTVFVEGDHDGEILQEGFKELFQRYRIRDLGGRINVEKEIELLQQREKGLQQMSRAFFILDRDDKPTSLKSSAGVRVLQWRRRCLENYLLDVNALTDLVKSSQYVSNPITNVVALKQTLKDLAYQQIDEVTARQIYTESQFANTSLTSKEMQGKTFVSFADIVFQKISTVKEQFTLINEVSWKAEFVSACERRKAELSNKWETAWEIECDGKKLIRDFHGVVKSKDNLLKFKSRIISMMRDSSSENWLAMDSLLRDLMKE